MPLVLPNHTSYPFDTNNDTNDCLPSAKNVSDDCNNPCNNNTTGNFNVDVDDGGVYNNGSKYELVLLLLLIWLLLLLLLLLLSTFEHLCKPII